MDSADTNGYSYQDDWMSKLDNPSFDATIDIANNKNFMKFDKEFANELLSNVKKIIGHDRVESSGHFIYPPTGYMGWHTNYTNPCTRLYITYATEDNKSSVAYVI